MSYRASLAFLAVAVAFLSGCATAPKAPEVQDSVTYTVADTGRVAFADVVTHDAIDCTGFVERFTADGKLDVVANVKNHSPQPMKIQVQCLFRDADGFTTPQTSPWQTLSLPSLATETVHFTALTTVSKRYTLRFRKAR